MTSQWNTEYRVKKNSLSKLNRDWSIIRYFDIQQMGVFQPQMLYLLNKIRHQWKMTNWITNCQLSQKSIKQNTTMQSNTESNMYFRKKCYAYHHKKYMVIVNIVKKINCSFHSASFTLCMLPSFTQFNCNKRYMHDIISARNSSEKFQSWFSESIVCFRFNICIRRTLS